MPAVNFIASYNLAKSMGAKVFLADVNPISGQMTPKNLLECIHKNNLKKIKVIITMYLGGYPENVVEFYKIKKNLNCILIEDACHALGAKYYFKKRYVNIGSCKHSDISTFSLHPVKTITTGEGGIVTTNNKFFYNKIKLFRSHGIKKKQFNWDYDILLHGYNYRLSDINCALGISQIKKIKKFINLRKKIYIFYKKKFEELKSYFKLPVYSKKNHGSYHLFLINLNLKNISFNKNIFLKKLIENNIICQFHYKPIFFFKKIFNTKFTQTQLEENFKGSIYYYKSTISLPIFTTLSRKNQYFITKKIKFLFKDNN
jgi:dTDP-4-amino-4,6-dideoxygalactose transaminase